MAYVTSNPPFEKKFASGVLVEQVIVFDRLKSKSLQINAKNQAYNLETTTSPGADETSDNPDFLGDDVPWVTIKASTTADYMSGGDDVNLDIAAARITSLATLTDTFEINGLQRKAGGRP